MNVTEETGALEIASVKDNPETLVMRGPPPRVVRFRRGVIIGCATAISATLVALTWLALEPVTFRTIANGKSGRPFERAAPEVIAGAPRDYRDVPVLGPPLPGDLGRPILEQQRRFDRGTDQPTVGSPGGASERAAALQEQRAATEQAARASSVVVRLSDGRVAGAEPHDVGGSSALEQVPVPAASLENKLQLGEWGRTDVNSRELSPPASRWVVAAGTVIPASLLTGLDSDLPGMVLAQVTENIRDSASGQAILIPQGARLIGRYDSSVSYGQKRALVIWQRILFPDGSSLRLDNMPASDVAGYAGLTDRVDGHSWQLLKGVIFSSLLGVGTQLSLGGGNGLVRAIRESVQQNGSQAGEQIVSQGLSVQPTIKVRPGWPVRVLVSEDLVLQPWKG